MCSHEGAPARPGVPRRSVLRGAALAAGGALLGGAVDLAAAPGALAMGEPRIYTRAEWGARSPKRSATVVSQAPDMIVVHHTATGNTTDYSKSHAAALSRSIQNHHMDTNGWDDTGQQLTISRGGYIMEGRNRSLPAIRAGDHVVGAHTADHNSHTVGIENEGTYTSAEPTGELLGALIETCAWLCLVYGLNPSSAIVGHRDFNPTSCPGDGLYAMLPRLRTDVGARLRSLEARLVLRDEADLPEEHLPTYPRVPVDERAVEHYHGPALGAGEV
ncbi:peptidoglycan recognition protein family protein [Streptomonospora sp. S1-112]|uniref:Peptidoglycan recognition protein family protein n=1 Tax=Streptomonospora mangrovi TaxID=2883123 RepID=A0A9X3NW04_9ACTN|nr:peptidoglycan recognition family protein [Streptomonospora mangrovi]MDA0565281.1 peptidoglycan recognition protein family protein [Streptomonospora mangrovi]